MPVIKDDIELLDRRHRIARTLNSWDYTVVYSIAVDVSPAEARERLLKSLVSTTSPDEPFNDSKKVSNSPSPAKK